MTAMTPPATDTASMLANILQEHCLPLNGDGFRCAPELEDEEFWKAAEAKCDTPIPKLAEYASELELIDISQIVPTLFLGDLSARTSPLALKLLGINGIVTVSPLSCEIQQGDKSLLEHFTLSPLLPVSPQLAKCCHFMRRNTPVLVCSSTGAGLAALVCAAHLAVENGLSATAAVRKVEGRRGPLKLNEDDLSDLGSFCASDELEDALELPHSFTNEQELLTPPSNAKKGGIVPERELRSASPTKSISSKSINSQKDGTAVPKKRRTSPRWSASGGSEQKKPKAQKKSDRLFPGVGFCYAEKLMAQQPSQATPPNNSFTSPFQRLTRASNQLGQCWWYQWTGAAEKV